MLGESTIKTQDHPGSRSHSGGGVRLDFVVTLNRLTSIPTNRRRPSSLQLISYSVYLMKFLFQGLAQTFPNFSYSSEVPVTYLPTYQLLL